MPRSRSARSPTCKAALLTKQPYYNATAKTYIVAYPKADLPKAKKVPAYTPGIIAGMEAGYVTLYQTCPHLGCRVPWCQSFAMVRVPVSWLEVQHGRSREAPPRGMDRFVFEVSRHEHRGRHRGPRHRAADRHQHHQPEPRRAALCLTPTDRRPHAPEPSPHEFPHRPDPDQRRGARRRPGLHRVPCPPAQAQPGAQAGEPHAVLRRRRARGRTPRARARRGVDRVDRLSARAPRVLHLGAVPRDGGGHGVPRAIGRARRDAVRQRAVEGVRQHQVAAVRHLPRG